MRVAFLALLLPGSAMAGEIGIFAPEGAELPRVSIYAAAAPLDAPLAQIGEAGPADLPDGRYVFGIDSYPWRSAPFDHIGTTALAFGTLLMDAPDGTEPRFTLHDAARGALVTPLPADGVPLALPEGTYELRHDLSEMTWPLDVNSGGATAFPLAGLSTAPPLPEGEVLYAAPASESIIAAMLNSRHPAVALPPGDYRLARQPGFGTVAARLVEGEVFTQPVRYLRGASLGEDDRPLVFRHRDVELSMEAGRFFTLLILGPGPLSVASRGGEALALADDGEVWVWRYPDGQFAQESGIPLNRQGGPPGPVAPGGEIALLAQVAFEAAGRAEVVQSGQVIAGTEVRLRAEESGLSLTLPQTATPGEAFEVRVVTGPEANPLSGRLGGFTVHEALADSPSGLEIVATRPTQVALAWRAVEGARGYRVYRGDGGYPASGGAPLAQTVFTDVGLSAARRYSYRVCPVDVLGLDGPCAEIAVETPQP